MSVSAVSISSNALVLLGGTTISSFTDDSTGSQIAALLYETTYHALLTETRWRFASRTDRLARHTLPPENSPWQYQFQLPSDCLYVTKCTDPVYEIYERRLYSNSSSVDAEIVFPVNEVNLPAYFVRALEYKLASLFAIPLTGDINKSDFYYKLAEAELKKARYNDASQRPPTAIEDSPYITARR